MMTSFIFTRLPLDHIQAGPEMVLHLLLPLLLHSAHAIP